MPALTKIEGELRRLLGSLGRQVEGRCAMIEGRTVCDDSPVQSELEGLGNAAAREALQQIPVVGAISGELLDWIGAKGDEVKRARARRDADRRVREIMDGLAYELYFPYWRDLVVLGYGPLLAWLTEPGWLEWGGSNISRAARNSWRNNDDPDAWLARWRKGDKGRPGGEAKAAVGTYFRGSNPPEIVDPPPWVDNDVRIQELCDHGNMDRTTCAQSIARMLWYIAVAAAASGPPLPRLGIQAIENTYAAELAYLRSSGQIAPEPPSWRRAQVNALRCSPPMHRFVREQNPDLSQAEWCEMEPEARRQLLYAAGVRPGPACAWPPPQKVLTGYQAEKGRPLGKDSWCFWNTGQQASIAARYGVRLDPVTGRELPAHAAPRPTSTGLVLGLSIGGVALAGGAVWWMRR